MAQTFKDYIVESIMYEHSREHYELMKECSELALMEQYIDDQYFLLENADEIYSEDSDVHISDGYLNEATFITEEIRAFTEGRKMASYRTSGGGHYQVFEPDELAPKGKGNGNGDKGAKGSASNPITADGRTVNTSENSKEDDTPKTDNKAQTPEKPKGGAVAKPKGRIIKIKAKDGTKNETVAPPAPLKDITDRAEKKKVNIFKRIWNGIKKMIDMFINFIKRTLNSFSEFGEKAKKIVTSLKDTPLSQEAVDTFEEIISDTTKETGIPGNEMSQKETFDIPVDNGVTYKDGFSKEKLNDAMYLALSNSSVTLYPDRLPENMRFALPIADLVRLTEGLTKHKKTYSIESVKNEIDGALKFTRQNGFALHTNVKELEKWLKKLSSLRDDLDKEFDSSNLGDSNAVIVANDAYTQIRKSMSSTMLLYAKYIAYRKKMIQKFVNHKMIGTDSEG